MGGKATVDLKRVEVSGIPIEGAALDFLVENYLIPNYPDAKIGRPFALHKRVDRIGVDSCRCLRRYALIRRDCEDTSAHRGLRV